MQTGKQEGGNERADAEDDLPVPIADGSRANPSPAPEAWTVQVHDDPRGIDAHRWDDLLAASPHPSPFLRHAWLAALHECGCAVPQTGWTPLFLTVQAPQSSTLLAACPLYGKTHSYGEYVFDWSWADACQRAGLRYYPKLLCATPFTPVPGSRLLVRTSQPESGGDDPRRALLAAMQQLAGEAGWSSAHVLFLDEADQSAARNQGWLLRQSVQFHWQNQDPATGAAYADFASMLAALHRDKRKKIQQERRRVAEAGVTVEVRYGSEITSADWDFFYACYAQTYREHGSQPYLNRAFFDAVGHAMREHWTLLLAVRHGRRVAASLLGVDRRIGAAYGRYWGALEHIPFLHFELCYYAPLQWCIAQGLRRFEGGAQGEHKMARGLLPVRTWSAHWLAHPGLARAVADFLERESQGVSVYVDELHEHNPFRFQAQLTQSGDAC